MSDPEIYRYFWIKVSDEGGRIASSKAALELQQSLRLRSRSARPGTDEERMIDEQRQMARRYLGGSALNATTKIVILANNDVAPRKLEVLALVDHSTADRSLDVSIATMPPDYRYELSRAWIATPVGRAWSAGAALCRLSYAVSTPATG